MRQEAEIYAEQDKRYIAMVELRNQADTLFYSYESTLKDNGNLISERLKAQATAKAAELKVALNDAAITVEVVKQKLNDFQQTLFAIGANVYNQAKQEANPFAASDSDATLSDHLSTLTSQEDLNVDFEDATVTTDYEAIE
jgi:molecular chaperone DnaK